MKNKNFKLNIGGTDERDLEQAIENSLKEMGKTQEEKTEMEKPAFFSGNAVKLESSGEFFIRN